MDSAAAFDGTFFALAVPAVLIAGISKAGFGSGAAFVGAVLLALVVDPWVALAVLLPLLMAIDVVLLRPYWGQWDWREAGGLILGGVPGAALGALLYTWADADVVRFLIGVIALGFVAWQLTSRVLIRALSAGRFPAWAALPAGVVAGFTSFVSHAGGPPVAVYLLGRGLGKTAYQATTVLVFWAINIAKVVPYAFLGIFSLETLTVGLWLLPVALLGAWIGVRAHRAIPERAFFAVTYVLLIGAGARLIWDALT